MSKNRTTYPEITSFSSASVRECCNKFLKLESSMKINRFYRMIGYNSDRRQASIIRVLKRKTESGSENTARNQEELLASVNDTIEKLSKLNLNNRDKQLINYLRQLHQVGETAQRDWQEQIQRNTVVEDYYALLGVERNASDNDIKKAYHRAARAHHPDRSNASESNDNMAQLNNAYKELSKNRTEYDALLADFENRSADTSNVVVSMS